jgi:hypothetical protein
MSQADIDAIESVIRGMFAAIQWDQDRAPDWTGFGAAVRPAVAILPSARPAAEVSLDAFVTRMSGLRDQGVLATFEETILGVDVQPFGNVAVARAAYTTFVNGKADGRGLNVFLLVKDAGAWTIAALAWDNESEAALLPADLAGD